VTRTTAWAPIANTLPLLLLCACLEGGPVDPVLQGSGTRILFIGNSFTYVNDVPGILQALADSAGGEKLAVESVAFPNYAVIDHWFDGSAQREIDKGGWAYVVLQQGWTPAGVCRDTLRLATELLSVGIRKAGGRPVLFEPWGSEFRLSQNQFLTSIESNRLAATDVDGLLFPVAEAWLATAKRDPSIYMYSDGLHANATGSYLAALVMYTRIFNRSPVGLPRRLVTLSGVSISMDEATGRTLQEAAAEVGLAPTPNDDPTTPPVVTSRC
jgi:hypothetical protein